MTTNPCPHTPTHWPLNMIACDTTSELRETIADAIRNNSHYGVAETPVINAVMKAIAAQSQQWEVAARKDELKEWIDDYTMGITEYTSEPKGSLILKPTKTEIFIPVSELQKRLAIIDKTIEPDTHKHVFTTAGNYDDGSCDTCGKRIGSK